MEYESVNKAKIQELNQRLNNFSNKAEEDSDGKYSYLQTRLSSFEERLRKTSNADDLKLRQLEAELHKAEEELRAEKREFDLHDERKDSELTTLEKSLTAQIQELSNQMRAERQKVMKCLDQKARAVKQDSVEAAQQFRQTCAGQYAELSRRIARIREVVEGGKKERSEHTQSMVRTFGDEILKLQELLNAEKGSRAKPNREASQLIDDIQDSLVEALQEEKREKDRNQELFTRLLEETCYKIQQTFLN